MAKHIVRQRVRYRSSNRRIGADLAAAGTDQAFIGCDQGGVGVDPDPAVAREHLDVEMQVVRSAVRKIEIVGDHANLFALGDAAAGEIAVGITVTLSPKFRNSLSM